MSLIMDFLCLELKVDYVVFDSWFSQPTLLHRIARTTIRKPFPACFTRGVRSFRHGFSKLPADCPDRKSTRLNSSHVASSYAVFCLKKKKPTLNNICINT